jgi:hypothetical protein
VGTTEEPQWVDPADYYDGLDIPGAVRAARSVAKGMLDGWVDPVVWLDEVKVAMEVLCDAADGDPSLALKAVKAIEYRFRTPQEWELDNRQANAARYACWATLIAEVAHRNKRYREAVVLTSSALDKVEEAAEGPEKLVERVASSKSDQLAKAVTAVCAIRIPALRRARYPLVTEDFIRKRTAGYIPAYLASGRIDPRSHAFSTQILFDEVEHENYDRLPVLRQISDETRGSSLRSRTTEPLVAMECHRALGDIPAAKLAAAEAEERIRSFGLWRHLGVMAEYGYLEFD